MTVQFAARSLGESGIAPLLLADTREAAARKALNRAGRAYVITWEVKPAANGVDHVMTARRAHHPDDIKTV